ncbi:hypothetical protein BC830DRAFT_310002 [Chytriomyces sp. MP71]|nr:hypothetical protein BC830DRAFT_310002 [Chytriomyces sp. MP71]
MSQVDLMRTEICVEDLPGKPAPLERKTSFVARQDRLWKGLACLVLGAFVILAGVTAIAITGIQKANTTRNDPGLVITPFPNGTDYVVVVAKTGSVDLASQTLRVLLMFSLSPSIAIESTGKMQVTLEESVYPINVTFGNQLLSFPAKSPLHEVIVAVPVIGDASLYPFDIWRCDFPVFASYFKSSTMQPLPVVAESYGNPTGFYATYCYETDNGRPDQLGSVTLTRSTTTKTFALLIAAAMWSLAICATLLALVMWVGDRKVEAPIIIFTTALLFSFPSLRNAMPGAPAIGALIDQMSLVWCMGLLSFTLPFTLFMEE